MTNTTSASNFFVASSGTRTHYTTAGNTPGPLIITLHGLGGSTETYQALIPRLPNAKYYIINVDFEGFGKTPLPDTPLSIPRYVANLDDLISFLQGPTSTDSNGNASSKPVVIIGHSLGAIVALHYAAKHPEKVAGLGLLGVGRSASHVEAARQRMVEMASKVRSEGIEVAAELAMSTNLPKDATEDLRQEIRERVAASDPEGYARTCEAVVDPGHVDPDYSRISCPAVFVTGDQDIISPPERAKEISGLISGAKEVFIVRGGHQPILNDLEGTSKALETLFQMVEA